uniref:Uncharacterized protein n=1 Tax=Tanacetum cinerariifolium TaxID=118510 RepID=A0A6L2JL62_TANCI|nr:hypothetical protein [Tanacetum cinerariifolium]
MSSLENREHEKQKTIATPLRSPKIDLSLNKAPKTELTDTDVPMYDVPSHSSQQRAKHLRRVVTRIDEILEKDVPPTVVETIDQLVKLIFIEEFLRKYKLNHAITLQPPASIRILTLQEQLYKAMRIIHNHMLLIMICGLYLRGKVREVFEEASPEFLAELRSLVERISPTMADINRMKETLDDMMKVRCKTTAKYVYHIEQATNYLNNQIIWESKKEELIPHIPKKEALVFFGPQRNPNKPSMFLWNKDFLYLKNRNTEAKKYVLSLHKIHATLSLENNLEELLTRWVDKLFKRYNEEARLSIQHWKQPWAKMLYKKKHRIERLDPNEVCSN